MRKILACCAVVFLLFALSNCSKESSPEPAPTPTNTPAPGTIAGTLTGLPDSNGYYVMYVDTDLNMGNGIVTKVEGSYTGAGSQAYSVTVTGGTFYVYAILDVNYNGIPDVGDYLGVYGATYPSYPTNKNVSVNGNTATAYISMASAIVNMYGTITLPASVMNKQYRIIVDLDGNLATTNDFLTGEIAMVAGDTINYSIVEPFPTTVYIYCYVDVDDSGDLNTGDYVGIYQTLPSGTPVSITNLGTLNGQYNFTLAVY